MKVEFGIYAVYAIRDDGSLTDGETRLGVFPTLDKAISRIAGGMEGRLWVVKMKTGFEVYAIRDDGSQLQGETKLGEFPTLDKAINCIADASDEFNKDFQCGYALVIRRIANPGKPGSGARHPIQRHPQQSVTLGEQAYVLKRDTALSWSEIAEEIGGQRSRNAVAALAKGYAIRRNLPWPLCDYGPRRSWWTWWT